jgi:1,4-dihydroxy-2-naphthoate octaprenyltransferase
LLLTPVCVFAGLATALLDGHAFRPLYFALAFLGALCAHVAVNVLNDYFDYRSGIDLKVQRTPFSGGSGILPAAQLPPREVLFFGLANLGIVLLIGLYFISVYRWAILPIGLPGVLLVLLYTPYLTRLPAVSELAAGGGFALMVLGVYFTQTGTYSPSAALVTLVAGLLVANLLLLNEFPDVEADKVGNRRHLPIILGREGASKVYCFVTALAYVTIVAGVLTGILPWLAFLGLVTLPLALKAMKGSLQCHSEINRLIPFLATNVMIVLLTPFLMSLGLLIWTFL